MKPHASSRFFGSCAIVAIPLTILTWATLELLRPDRSPLRNMLNEYLGGPFSFLGRVAGCLLAATFLMLLLGLRISVRPSGFLTASCVLLGVVVVSLCVTAVFPADTMSPDDSRHIFTWAGIVHMVSAARFYALLMALLLTLPSAYKRDEKWRSFSRVTLFLGFLILAFDVGLMFAPLDLRGLVQRGTALVILAWLLLTSLRLRRIIPFTHGTAV